MQKTFIETYRLNVAKTRNKLHYARALVRTTLRMLRCGVEQKSNNGVYAIQINCNIGFFAQINWCMWIIYYCKMKSLRPHIVLSSTNYTSKNGDNWFDYYFENKSLLVHDKLNLDANKIRISLIRHITEIPYYYRRAPAEIPMDLNTAGQLINEYIAIRPSILNEVELFIQQKIGNRKVLGIHYRGTDKVSEAPRVSVEYCIATIRKYLAAHAEIECIFVASDEANFIKRITSEFIHYIVVSYDSVDGAQASMPIHLVFDGNNYSKGKDALVNCILLSRCDALIKTASFLSAWACVFNPNIPVILLNRPYSGKNWFPDREVARNSMDNYLLSPAQ